MLQSRDEVRTFLLDEGLALENGEDGAFFICPPIAEDDGLLGAAAGNAVLTVSQGAQLLILTRDGHLVPHAFQPDTGERLIDLTSGPRYAYALGADGVDRRVYQLDSRQGKLLWETKGTYDGLASAEDSSLVLAGVRAGVLQVALHPPAASPRVYSAPVATHAVAAFPYMVQAEVFIVVLQAGGMESSLWKLTATEPLDDAALHQVALTPGLIGGVVGLEAARYVAYGGHLGRLTAAGVEEIPLDDPATCVGRLGDMAYACTSKGLRELTSQGLGAPLFELAALQPPPLPVSPECDTQWQRYKLDLAQAEVTLRAPHALSSEVELPDALPEEDDGSDPPSATAPEKTASDNRATPEKSVAEKASPGADPTRSSPDTASAPPDAGPLPQTDGSRNGAARNGLRTGQGCAVLNGAGSSTASSPSRPPRGPAGPGLGQIVLWLLGLSLAWRGQRASVCTKPNQLTRGPTRRSTPRSPLTDSRTIGTECSPSQSTTRVP